MRYHTENLDSYITSLGRTYKCNHPLYNYCTLFKIGGKGIAVIQQRFIPSTKTTYWSQIDPWLSRLISDNDGFSLYFKKYAKEATDGLYPTVTIRQIMWALRIKPLPKQRWETVFDHKDI